MSISFTTPLSLLSPQLSALPVNSRRRQGRGNRAASPAASGASGWRAELLGMACMAADLGCEPLGWRAWRRIWAVKRPSLLSCIGCSTPGMLPICSAASPWAMAGHHQLTHQPGHDAPASVAGGECVGVTRRAGGRMGPCDGGAERNAVVCDSARTA
uniref:Uncharacterized protein n=1 Tax=Arundo donax TaxID=35708 RepID=A0A0A9EDE3_ARUDO